MKVRNMLIAAMAAGLCVMPQMVSMAAVVSNTQEIGPGFETPASSNENGNGEGNGVDYSATAWKKVNGVYLDDEGNPIEGAILRGVSVSKWQGNVNWAKAAADDVSFALIRMGSFGYEGEYTMDEYFDQNMRQAKANGIHTAPYVYLQTRTVEEAKAAAEYAVSVAQNYEIDYPIAADVESSYIMDLSVQELTDVVNAFCQVISDHGYQAIIYSDYNKFTTKMDTNQFPYDIWLARYGGSNQYANRTMWQCTDKGQVDGISGNVCIEFAFKDYAAGTGNQEAEGPGAVGPGGSSQTNSQGQAGGPGAETLAAHADGWDNSEGVWYYYQGGQKVNGWILLGDIWYYLDPSANGAMAADTTMEIDGVSYSFDGSGAML